MTARERAKALAFYVKEETSEWTGHMIPRFVQEIETAEREAWNSALEAAASKANYVFVHAEGSASDAGFDIEKEIRRLTK